MTRKQIGVFAPCYNEAGNVEEFVQRVNEVTAGFPNYDFSIWFIDNASDDGTTEILRRMAAANDRIKVIVNARNFGHIRSPIYGFLQVQGDAVISLASDLQDPPELIAQFIPEWEKGFPIVLGIKSTSEESSLKFWLRTQYYRNLTRLSGMPMYENATGIGMFDRKVIEIVRSMQDPYPYFRGMLAEIGLPASLVEYRQRNRMHGKGKNNWYTLFDTALLGMTNHTKIPLRLATIFGFCLSLGCFALAILYVILKLIFWDRFALGSAPLIISFFFLGSVQLFFTGIIGEYLGAVYTLNQKRPLVVERERINC